MGIFLIKASDYVRQKFGKISFNSGSWVVLGSIEQQIKSKIESIGKPLKDWDIQINYGIKTGFNEAFIIDTAKRNELVEKCPKAAQIIRPILRGRDIKKYKADWADLWLIYIPWHFPLHLDVTIKGASDIAEEAFKNLYPEIYNHLSKYKDQLSKRNQSETGIRYEWYALQRYGSNYMEDFFKPKIMYPNMTKFLPFIYDENSYMINDKGFIITGQHIEFLTAFFNSKVFKFCFKENFPELMGNFL